VAVVNRGREKWRWPARSLEEEGKDLGNFEMASSCLRRALVATAWPCESE
jgi:hypothetical protein